MKAVILAAGRGVRFKPFTLTRPKPMIPVGGRPILEWTLVRLFEAGVKDVVIVTHHLEEQIIEYFGDGSRLGLNISYARQKSPKGTADAFRLMEEFSGSQEFIGLYSDYYLVPGVLEKVLKFHKKGENTLAVLSLDDPWSYGVVDLEGDRVKRIVEKPEPGSNASHMVNLGIYVFTPEIFRFIGETKPSKRNEYEITDSIRMMIESNSTVRACTLDPGMWLDVGLPWNLLDANELALCSMDLSNEGDLEDGAKLIGPVKIGKGSRVRAGAYIEGPVFIGDNCDIGPNCYLRPSTSIGSEVRIGNASEIKNSIVMNGTHIAHLSYVGDSVIGERCNLGAGTITANIRFDKNPVKVNIEGKRVDSGKRKLGSLIGDDVQTGINVSLMPGVKVGPEAWIGPGLTVFDDVPEKVLLTSQSGSLRAERQR